VLDRAHALAADEHFLHWQIAFPRIWRDWTSAERRGGFDAVIGNPPWDRMKMQEVEWFAARAPAIARQPRAADRKAAIKALEGTNDPLAALYETARNRAETAARLATRGGDYPLLGRGDVNIYSLFVERAQQLIAPEGIAGLLVPSGILSDKNSSPFLEALFTTKRIQCGIDFFNRRDDGTLFFPDVYYRYKFCVFVSGGFQRSFPKAQFAFFMRRLPTDIDLLAVSENDVRTLSPAVFGLPVFRDAQDALLAIRIAKQPSLVTLRENEGARYVNMYHMAADSHAFHTMKMLEERGAYALSDNSWRLGDEIFYPLYEGKMVQAFDHRASDLTFYSENILRTGEGYSLSEAEHADVNRFARPRYFVNEPIGRLPHSLRWSIAFKDITSTTNTRTMIAAAIPYSGAGHTLPLLAQRAGHDSAEYVGLLANLNAFPFDFMARQKVSTNHFTLFVLEQLPVVPSDGYERRFGAKTAADIVKDHVLRLTYTAHDMAPFARDMGYVDADGNVLSPIVWDEAERRQLRARLDALYFHLYGVTDEADLRYILGTFPIVERKDREAHGCYLTAEMILWHMRALAAGDTETDAPVDTLIRAAKDPA
jgi:hypothetical protein